MNSQRAGSQDPFAHPGGRRNVFGSMPVSSFIHDLDPPDYTDAEPETETIYEESPASSALRRDLGAPRRPIPQSPSFDRVAERFGMKRGDSDGGLAEPEHARSSSMDALSAREQALKQKKGGMTIRQTIVKKGGKYTFTTHLAHLFTLSSTLLNSVDSLASLFRLAKGPLSAGTENGTTLSTPTLHQPPSIPSDDRRATEANLSSSTMRRGGWGAIMRKATRAVTPETTQVFPGLNMRNMATLKKKGSTTSISGLANMGRNSISRNPSSSEFGETSTSTRKSDHSDDLDDDLDSTGESSMDDLSLWVSTTSLTSLYTPKTLQLSVEHRAKTLAVRVLYHGTVADAIQSILIDFAQAEMHQPKDCKEEAVDRTGYRLCKLDRNVPGVRVWMDPQAILGSYDFMQGDEVRLKHINDIETSTITIPPSTTPHHFAYSFTVLVKDAVAQLREEHLTKEEKYGLYYPRLGIWLDDGRTLFSYDLQQEKNLELRALAHQFLLRIYLPEFDQKIALKVLPSLRVSDVIAMIHYQLSNRKLTLGHRGGKYGLFIPSQNTWMKESVTLGEYATIQTEDVQYKLQYELVSVLLDLPHIESAPIRILVDQTTTVETLLETVGLVNPDAEADVYCLFSPAGDRLSDRDIVWTAVKDFAHEDSLRYRAIPKRIILSNTADADVKLDLDIDFTLPLSRSIPFLCRRFGRQVDEVDGIETDAGVALDVTQSLQDQHVKPGTQLYLQVTNRHIPQTQGSPSMWDEPDTDENIQMMKDPSGVMMVGSGTLNKLVERLTDERGEGTSQYLDYVKTFLLTYQSFTTGAILLRKLIERYHAPRSRKATFASYDHFRLTIQLRVCNVILQWVKRHPADFVVGKDFWADAMRFVEDVLAYDHPSMGRQIRRNLVKIKDNTHPALVKHLVLKSPLRATDGDPRRFNVFRHPPDEIARQLTLIEHAYFADILPSELLNQAWSKPDAPTKAPNVVALTRRFNAVACWTAKSILEMKTPRARAKRITGLVEIASQLLTLNNFSTLMAIIAGLNKAAVIRLKQSFKEIGSKTLKKLTELEKLMTAEGSYKGYRAHMRTVGMPCIPYM
ncbi:uncharacterized protein SPPG_06715 [Spizellomyces punctatus DAOM BR117]|uniref:Ras-GEF domain-containing protein n=1 Tax=Spizellomyces punctatus (strain DAOM BR117) TaxID=645134 RepID=A0A0L0HAV2_SPIPD|nr:uncharacterized protein SPPG_06715 [Spizellomyces punctatus DAOM BR117]KNC98322.1 hypothetical protein SPPG_06715 [Spizellomyces punctatus DAOM BR117]|eukprot:XP_016606362.1 hypothetical protein SPPG_06715 [Spizellomyces punctatus DAOM BR117]